jgi:hypothetical protein
MARVPVRFSLTLQDSWDITQSCLAYVSVEETLPPGDLQAAFGRWVERVAAVSDGKVVSARVGGEAVAVPDRPDKPAAHTFIGFTGLLTFTLLLHTHVRSWTLAVPAFARALVGSGGIVDETNPALSALVEEMSTGGAGYSFTNQNNNPLGRLSKLGWSSRTGKSKQLRARSRTTYTRRSPPLDRR